MSQSNVSVVPNNSDSSANSQDSLLQRVALIADRYMILDMVEGSTLYKCLDVRAGEELVCKVSEDERI